MKKKYMILAGLLLVGFTVYAKTRPKKEDLKKKEKELLDPKKLAGRTQTTKVA